jgi:hypothetical protein
MSRADSSGGGSRPSQTNCQGHSEGLTRPNADSPEKEEGEPVEPDDFDGALRPLSVSQGTQLRDEALVVRDEHGHRKPLTAPNVTIQDGEVLSRPWYRVLNQHTDWYTDYLSSHIEFTGPEGETVRGRLENSYQPQYGDKYYARLMDLKRGIERRWSDFSICMLTLSASTLDTEGQPRPPADHMTDIREGWATARKQLYHVLDGRRWAYARVWEPTTTDGEGPAGYGHMHLAVFVEDGDDLQAQDFRPVMDSYVSATPPAGWEAHRPAGDGVSVTHQLEEANAATYVSEYIGQYGDHLQDRPIHERAFLAVAWATNTRRVEFNQVAQEIVKGEEFRRETGLRPEDRGGASVNSEGAEPGAEPSEGDGGGSEGEGEGWEFESICDVSDGRPEYYDPAGGGVSTARIDGRGNSEPRDLGPPPDG